MKTLEDIKALNNTYVIFMSDVISLKSNTYGVPLSVDIHILNFSLVGRMVATYIWGHQTFPCEGPRVNYGKVE
jgi:hypothetical protein